MSKEDKKTNNHLREKAESINKKRGRTAKDHLSDLDMLKLIQELEIHKIELEVQNEELIRLQSISEESIKKYSELYEFAPSAYFTLSLEGEIKELNLTGSKILGMDRSIIINTRLDSFMSSENKERFKKLLENICNRLMKDTCEIELINKKNQAVHLLLSGVLSEDENKFNLTAIDISELKKAEKEIIEEKTRSKQYLDIANVILISIAPSGSILYINPKGCEVLRYPEGEITGKNWFDMFIPPGIREEVREVAGKIYSGEIEAVRYFENPVLTSSGEERLIAWHNSVLRDEKGIIIATLSSGEDITEKKKKEEELENYRDSLEFQVKERTQELENTLKELSDRNLELERFFNATIDREIKHEDLRIENIELRKKLDVQSDLDKKVQK